MTATYEEVKDIPNHPEKYLIDVRAPEELQQTGIIPASINIPLNILERALQYPDAEFLKKFGRSKPGKNAVIIFSCRSGKRAGDAINIAKNLGFTNAKNYTGSWLEWAERSNF